VGGYEWSQFLMALKETMHKLLREWGKCHGSWSLGWDLNLLNYEIWCYNNKFLTLLSSNNSDAEIFNEQVFCMALRPKQILICFLAHSLQIQLSRLCVTIWQYGEVRKVSYNPWISQPSVSKHILPFPYICNWHILKCIFLIASNAPSVGNILHSLNKACLAQCLVGTLSNVLLNFASPVICPVKYDYWMEICMCLHHNIYFCPFLMNKISIGMFLHNWTSTETNFPSTFFLI
jgi:hypothetical protein